MDMEPIQTVCARVREQVRKTVVGQDGALDLMLVALLSEGHVLLEGVPGTAKTLLAQSFARSVNLDFGRIQFTPDLMPGDVIEQANGGAVATPEDFEAAIDAARSEGKSAVSLRVSRDGVVRFVGVPLDIEE